MVAAAGAAVVIVVAGWLFWPALRLTVTPPVAVHTTPEGAHTFPSVLEPPRAPRLSIVVLPFANLSTAPEQQYFADGITDDLTTDLSRIADTFVISRNTAFTYKDKPANAKQIGRELGVRYVLEGSVRRLGLSSRPVIERSEMLAARALIATPGSPVAHQAKATALFVQRRYEEAIPEYETVIALDRNRWEAYSDLGICKFWTGSVEETIPLEEQALRLNPRDPQNGLRYLWIGRAHLLQSRLDEAIPWFERARIANPEFWLPHVYLASVYALTGDTKRGASELAEARRLSFQDRVSSLARLKAIGYWGEPKVRELFEATFFAGLRKAGMPEE